MLLSNQNTFLPINLNSGDELVASVTKKRQHHVPPYFAIGRSTFMNYRLEDGSQKVVEGFNMTSILRDLSANATWLFWTLVMERDLNTNIAQFTPIGISEKNKVKKGYKELEEAKLIIRVKRQTYLINPKAILPKFQDFAQVYAHWTDLIKQKKP
ncbi:hypothetical protein E0H77_06630 [Acinetobacter sp. ANC 4633]|uniref:hypothetical protein n=1 Tax=Acinetobacter sp. ANC 4633 TaxID=2529845 RepID=UPI00103EB654|nr:hypothetical protein [Acinetobacter sp. ANC 4633]TCB26349.1 hypothetical protein E0H77_06630 [Acinetobacter sp. ANC 4633]